MTRATTSRDDPRIAASEALLEYISARLELQIAGATSETLVSRLREGGISPELEERVREVLTAGESARYTPAAVSAGGTGNQIDQAVQLLEELEEALAE